MHQKDLDFEYIRLNLGDVMFIDNLLGYGVPMITCRLLNYICINCKKIKYLVNLSIYPITKAYKYKTKNINSTIHDILRHII